jgi:type IV pilus assembly protein PilB
MKTKSKKKIGDLLIEFGYITEAELRSAISEQEKMDIRLGEV